jgi:hypothetical protein
VERDDDLQRFLDDNSQELERVQAALESNLQEGNEKPDEPQAGGAGEGGEEAKPGDAVMADAEAAPPEPASAPPREEDELDAERSKRDRCATACRSLASMKRAEARICELAGENSEKCSWAHARVKDAVDRIQRAGCACS